MKYKKRIAHGFILLCAAGLNMVTSCSTDKNIDTSLPPISIATQPAIPVAVCSGSGIQTISVSVPSIAGSVITYSWRKAGISIVNGGVITGQGTNVLTLANPGIGDAGSYDVVVSNGSSFVTSQTVIATVNAIPSITETTPGSRTGTGTVTLGAMASAGTPHWYATATGGTPLGLGTSFITNSISATTIFYVEAVNLGCTSALRTSVIATVNATGVSTVVGAAGKTWMAYNLGATAVAASATDYKQYGSLYQWGRGSDGHQLITWVSTTKGILVNGTTTQLSTTDTPVSALFILPSGLSLSNDWRSPKSDALWQGVSGINNPCPSGYRLPTIAEWNAEISASGIKNTATAYSSSLKLVTAGQRSVSGLGNQGVVGEYWSSSVNTNSWGQGMVRIDNQLKTTYSSSSIGLSVRCLKD